MKIKDKEVKLKITPRAIEKIESMCDIDILKMLREAGEKEPKASDYYKLIYAGYIGSTGEEITYDEFLKLIEDIDLPEISQIGVNLLLKRKKLKFQEGFKKATSKKKDKNKKQYKIPDIHIESLADMYVFYVHMDGIDENTFWNSDIAFLENVHENIVAYENYRSNPKEVK